MKFVISGMRSLWPSVGRFRAFVANAMITAMNAVRRVVGPFPHSEIMAMPANRRGWLLGGCTQVCEQRPGNVGPLMLTVY